MKCSLTSRLEAEYGAGWVVGLIWKDIVSDNSQRTCQGNLFIFIDKKTKAKSMAYS
jgi:hypothetical protein